MDDREERWDVSALEENPSNDAALGLEEFVIDPKQFTAIGRLLSDDPTFRPSTAFIVGGNTVVSCLHCAQQAITEKMNVYFLSSKYYDHQKERRMKDGVTVIVNPEAEHRNEWIPIDLDSIKTPQENLRMHAKEENEVAVMTAKPSSSSLEEQYGSLPLAAVEFMEQQFWSKPVQVVGFPGGSFEVHKYRYLEGLLNRTLLKSRCLDPWHKEPYRGVAPEELKLYPLIFGCRATNLGASGSPVLVRTENGYRVIGVHYAGNDPQTSAFAVSVRVLRSFAMNDLGMAL
jgi:hypothetical protein